MEKYFLVVKRSPNNEFDQLFVQRANRITRLTSGTSMSGFYRNYVLKELDSCDVDEQGNLLDQLFDKHSFYQRDIKEHFEIKELTNRPGEFNPRIYRPILKKEIQFNQISSVVRTYQESVLPFVDYFPHEEDHLVSSINQLGIIQEMFNSAANTVHPTESNLNAFGNNFKNILLISCIEVETHFSEILKKNNISSRLSNSNYNTSDFLKLKPILKLESYSTRLTYFPHLGFIRPFENWRSHGGSTRTLSWYDGYNKVKHEGEPGFINANLLNVIRSMCAVAILIKAQFGNKIPYWNERLGNFFEFLFVHEWETEEKILPPYAGQDWRPVNYQLVQ